MVGNIDKKARKQSNKIIFVILLIIVALIFLLATGRFMNMIREFSGVEVYITEVTITPIPLLESPISDANFIVSVQNYKSKIESELVNRYTTENDVEDRIGEHGANINYELNLTIVDDSETVIFQKIFNFDKGYSRTIKVYKSASESVFDSLINVIIRFRMTLTLPDDSTVNQDLSTTIEKNVGEDISR